MPIFSKPTDYYFQQADSVCKKTLQDMFAEQTNKNKKKNAKLDLKTLVGLWLLLIKLGYYLPFPQVERYSRFFSPVNEKRLGKLGESWLKQLGLTDENLHDPNMLGEVCKRILASLRHGKKRLGNHPDTEGMDIEI